MKLRNLSVPDQYHQFLGPTEPAPFELNQSDSGRPEEWKSWVMNKVMEINLPDGQYQGKDPESASSGARVLGEPEPIPLLGWGFQSPDLQSAERKFVKKEKSKNDRKGCKRILTGIGDLRIEADTMASLSEEEDSEVTTSCMRGMIRLF